LLLKTANLLFGGFDTIQEINFLLISKL